MKKTQDFSNKALILLQNIEEKLKVGDMSSSLALTILTLKSTFDEGFNHGRFYEQHGYFHSEE